ncbi:MAG: HopJ type III effector protein [Thiomicrorhabdus sp.]|nr:HopJ type III effector protein [Thiomicrorhabdus sp.]
MAAAPLQKTPSNFILGIDMGTSGIRGVIVEKNSHSLNDNIRHTESISLSSLAHSNPTSNALNTASQTPETWITLLNTLFKKLSHQFDLTKINHLIMDATSSTVLLCSPQGNALTDALMYNHQQATQEAKQIQKATGFDSETAAQGASSTLAKVLFLLKNHVKNTISPPPIICHQIDFLNHYLCDCLNITDENNALKLGYNSKTQQWPNWIKQLLAPLTLPKVVAPGTVLGNITAQRASQYGFSPSLKIHAGTTDSIAGFLASGASQMGDAVISLGSTLAIKIISPSPIFNKQYGIYSHKLKENWLVGGASNAGGAVLLNAYTLPEIEFLIKSLTPLNQNNLKVTNQYYPLNATGERFPISDAQFTPKMPPKPKQALILNPTSTSDLDTLNVHQTYFLNLIKGLVYIESLAYKKLFQETKQPINNLYCVGGGEKNSLWQQCRTAHFTNAKTFDFPLPTLKQAHSLDAAYGVTKLIQIPKKGKRMTHINPVNQLIQQLNQAPVDFKKVMEAIESSYDFSPTEFKNGKLINAENSNNGSCKIFAFGQLNQLSEQATLNAFGQFYTKDVLENPNGDDHQNIRNFIQFGWQGITFEKRALTKKSSSE